MKQASEQQWLAAEYHFPSLYACPMPLSSTVSRRAMPAPSPATIRLALIRKGIEHFGRDYTRDYIFPIICTMPVYIRPPERVALSNQVIRAYKVTPGKIDSPDRYDQAPIYREMAHARGPITLWIKVPDATVSIYHELLLSIGYWGTADSFASCTNVYPSLPLLDECITPIKSWSRINAIGERFICLVTELTGPHVQWAQIMPTLDLSKGACCIQHELYVWPMIIREQRSTGTILLRCSHPI